MTIKGKVLGGLIAIAGAFVMASPSHAVGIIYANSVDFIQMGDPTISQFPGEFYGGNFPGAFPVTLSQAEAEASVLGPTDGAFLTLHGDNNTPSGSAFEDALVIVSFGTLFSASSTDLLITELGNNGESAHIFLFLAAGGNIQFDITRGASDEILIDLSIFSGFGLFDAIGIGGLDLLGASWGFDLDSVALVPEPGTLALLSIGLVVFGFSRRRKKI